MPDSVPSFLAPWSNFYVMTGSAAAALTGLMFVVVTLVTGTERARRSREGTATFSTPTVVHFGAALLFSAILSAPWRALVQPAAVLGLAGLCGVVYMLRILHRARRLTVYSPDVEDWAWYTILPFLAYSTIVAGALMLSALPIEGLFALAAGVLLLIFVGIHNAWDIVTFLAIGEADEPPSSD